MSNVYNLQENEAVTQKINESQADIHCKNMAIFKLICCHFAHLSTIKPDCVVLTRLYTLYIDANPPPRSLLCSPHHTHHSL